VPARTLAGKTLTPQRRKPRADGRRNGGQHGSATPKGTLSGTRCARGIGSEGKRINPPLQVARGQKHAIHTRPRVERAGRPAIGVCRPCRRASIPRDCDGTRAAAPV